MMIDTFIKFFGGFYFLFLRVMSGGTFPGVLGEKEERGCFERMKKGDMTARDTLIEHNLRLVAHVIKKYYTNYEDTDDLMSVGTIGLIKAIDTFDEKKDTRFATYAGTCVKNEILMYFRSRKRLACELSVNDAIETDGDGDPLTYLDVISVEDDMAEQLDIRMNCEKAENAIAEVLTDRERTIIMLRYGLTGSGRSYAQREIAKKLGISRSYVSRIEKTAMDKLRGYMFPEKENMNK